MALLSQVYTFLLFLHLSFINSHHLCNSKESFALLEFKKAFSLDESASPKDSPKDDSPTRACDPETFYPKTSTWNESTDCCSWDGVECDEQARVIGLDLKCSWLNGTLHPNSTLFTLSQLQSLDLSFNNFGSSPFPPQFGTLTNLRVLDLTASSFKGDIPSEISQLSKLVSLNLSNNNYLSFSNLVMNHLLLNLTHLRDFSFANADLSQITPTVSMMNFSLSLSSLHLSSSLMIGNFPNHIFGLPHLRMLQLDENIELNGRLPTSKWSKSLEILDLVFTNFSGEIPESIGNAESLRFLNLRSCKFTGGIPKSIGKLTQLNTIDLSANRFNGQLPNTWNSLQKLTSFQIHTNSFMGQLPSSLFNLTQLSNLKASSNLFSGPLPIDISSYRLSNLTFLDLKGNSLNGSIPSWLYALPGLTYLDLSNNHFTSFMRDFRYNSLEFLDLSFNNLQGAISGSVHRQMNLQTLALGSNNFSGVLNFDMLLRIQSLRSLAISNNNQVLIHSVNVSSVNNLAHVEMGSLKLEKFPEFLRYSKNLGHLDLSNNQIRGEIPKWFSEFGALNHLNLSRNFMSSGIELLLALPFMNTLSLDSNSFNLPIPSLPPSIYNFFASNNQFSGNIHPSICKNMHLISLDLSYNNLSGEIPSCLSNMNFLMRLELRRNNFSGSIPMPPPLILIYIASENQLTGEIPSSICEATHLLVFSLSNNQMSGAIPPCIANMTSLIVLDLKMNNLSGTIPTSFQPRSQLGTLNLNSNQIEGELPQSLLNCENLQVLDVGNNKITGYFPEWLEVALSLRVLILRSNKFHGHINDSMNKYSFLNLRIIDLSDNQFNGSLPSSLFKNLRAMKEVEARNQKPLSGLESDARSYYDDSVVVSLKGNDIELQRILLIFKALDLSSNDFSGEIPESIGMLKSLKGLKLSHNKLTSEIPASFGNLINLEWLDLSSNRLFGSIPSQLVALTFLSFMNLSQNRLSGPIPNGNQFSTFKSSSYAGNLGLCGFPLSNCVAENSPTPLQLPHEEKEEGDGLGKEFWLRVVSMGYGCGIVLGISVGYIVLEIGKPVWIAAMVEAKIASIIQRSKKRSRRRHRKRNVPFVKISFCV